MFMNEIFDLRTDLLSSGIQFVITIFSPCVSWRADNEVRKARRTTTNHYAYLSSEIGLGSTESWLTSGGSNGVNLACMTYSGHSLGYFAD